MSPSTAAASASDPSAFVSGVDPPPEAQGQQKYNVFWGDGTASILQPSEESGVGITGVETDRGATSFLLESEDDVRKLGPHRVMIADSNGIRYTIPDVRKLDSHSQRIVQRLV